MEMNSCSRASRQDSGNWNCGLPPPGLDTWAPGFRKNCQLETGGFVAGASLMIRTGVWLKAAALGLFCLGFFFSRLRASLFPMLTACHRSIDLARAYGIQTAALTEMRITEPRKS